MLSSALSPGKAMEQGHESANWSHLPSEIVLLICQMVACAMSSCATPYAAAKTLLRMCCKDWWAALPIGHSLPANIWEWGERMTGTLALNVRDLRVLSPQTGHIPGSPLPHLASCQRLRSLTLRHVTAAALKQALAPLEALTSLHVTVYWEMAARGWLDFASHLTRLQELTVAAAVIRLHPEVGLTALVPLAGSLRRLRLDDCVLVGDVGAASLARLGALSTLSVVPSALGQAGTDQLAGALTRLQQLRMRVQDGVDPSRLVGLPGLTAVSLQMSGIKAKDFIAVAGHLVPQARRLSVLLHGARNNFVLSAPFQGGDGLAQLEVLNLTGMQLSPAMVAQMTQYTALRELTAELDWTVRGGVFDGWGLNSLTKLSLHCNYYLRDADWQAMLAGLPHLQDLSLDNMHGSGAAARPLRGTSALTRLRLGGCHFESAVLLGEALAGVVFPGRGGAGGAKGPRLTVLELEECGVQSAVIKGVIMALGGVVPQTAGQGSPPEGQGGRQAGDGSAAAAGEGQGQGETDESQAPALRELKLELKWRVGSEAAAALARAIAGCTQLTALDVHFPALSDPQAPVPAWATLSSLTALRTLHVCSGIGWTAGAMAAVAVASPSLRQVALTDNHYAITDAWLEALAPLSQLSSLELNSCKRLSEEGAERALTALTALTSLQTYRCTGITNVRFIDQLKRALPCLAKASLRE